MKTPALALLAALVLTPCVDAKPKKKENSIFWEYTKTLPGNAGYRAVEYTKEKGIIYITGESFTDPLIIIQGPLSRFEFHQQATLVVDLLDASI